MVFKPSIGIDKEVRQRIHGSDKSGKYTLSWYIGQSDLDLYLDVADNSTGEVKTIRASEITRLSPELRGLAISLLKLMVRTNMALLPWLHSRGYDELIDELEPISDYEH